jgi:hypothetical protein
MAGSHQSAAVLTMLMALGAGPTVALAQSSQEPPATDVSRQNGTLSDKLGATNGVIRPEGAVDPGIDKGAPATGKTPVIPPAGSAGNPTDAQPK